MIPFFIFYSMFGFQRIGDLIWAAADMRTRGFLLGATAGRTTLNGEGLQHEDGHSHVLASVVPNLLAYDPAFAYELAVIIQDGLRRMYTSGEDVFYYITLYNENYPMPPMPEGATRGSSRGSTSSRAAPEGAGGPPAGPPARQRLASCARPCGPRRSWPSATASPPTCGAPPATRSCAATPWRSSAGTCCTPTRSRHGSPTSTQLLRGGGRAHRRRHRLHEAGAGPDRPLGARAASMPWAPTASAAATPGEALRRFFEVDAESVAIAALHQLARRGAVDRSVVRAGHRRAGGRSGEAARARLVVQYVDEFQGDSAPPRGCGGGIRPTPRERNVTRKSFIQTVALASCCRRSALAAPVVYKVDTTTAASTSTSATSSPTCPAASTTSTAPSSTTRTTRRPRASSSPSRRPRSTPPTTTATTTCAGRTSSTSRSSRP